METSSGVGLHALRVILLILKSGASVSAAEPLAVEPCEEFPAMSYTAFTWNNCKEFAQKQGLRNFVALDASESILITHSNCIYTFIQKTTYHIYTVCPRSLCETNSKIPFSVRRNILELILKLVRGISPVCFVPLSQPSQAPTQKGGIDAPFLNCTSEVTQLFSIHRCNTSA